MKIDELKRSKNIVHKLDLREKLWIVSVFKV